MPDDEYVYIYIYGAKSILFIQLYVLNVILQGENIYSLVSKSALNDVIRSIQILFDISRSII